MTIGGKPCIPAFREAGPKDTIAGPPVAVRQAARLLGVCPRTVHAWATAGRIPHFRTPGGHLRFHPQELARFARGRDTKGAAVPAANARLLVLCEDARRKELGAALPHVAVQWEEDCYWALASAASIRPDLTVVAAPALEGVHVDRYLRALHRASFNRGIYLLGDCTPTPKGVIPVAHIGELRNIVAQRWPRAGHARRSTATKRRTLG